MSPRPRARGITLPEWITPRGIDLGKLPIGPVLRQALAQDIGDFRSACNLLASMASHGRQDAGVLLLGLLSYHRADLERLTEVVVALGAFHSREAVNALVSELRRVTPNNTTRRYLDAVLAALSRLPREFSHEALVDLSGDRTFSVKWRRKFEEAAWHLREYEEYS